ncbi:MAG: fibronectin type III domain-containing protein [Eubacterium sp.]
MKKLSKLLSVLLTMVMLFSITVPANAYAAAKPKATSISSVTAKGGAFTVKWKKVSGVTGYQVKYSTSSKFAKDKTKTLKVSQASTASKTISGLTSRKKYYVRVRTYKTANKKTTYSSWSKTKSVTTKVKAVSISKLTSKEKGFKVSWKKTSGITGYQIQYSTSSKFKNSKTSTVTKNSTTSKTISKLKDSKKYYVRLRAYKTVNGKKYYSSWSDKKSVTTSAYYCDEGGSHHRRNVGQIGWYNTYNEALNAVNSYMDKYGEAHYTIVRCSCGLYTAYIN